MSKVFGWTLCKIKFINIVQENWELRLCKTKFIISRSCSSVQKNSAVAGAITGAALALTAEDATHEHIVQCAITGAAISTAANLLSGIF